MNTMKAVAMAVAMALVGCSGGDDPQQNTADAGVDGLRKLPTPDAAPAPKKDGPPVLDGWLVEKSTGCADESAEPNNSGDTATRLVDRPALASGVICYPGDIDFYLVNWGTDAKGKASVRIDFDAGADLELAVTTKSGQLIAQARTSDGTFESVGFDYQGGPLLVAVWGFGDQTGASYTLKADY